MQADTRPPLSPASGTSIATKPPLASKRKIEEPVEPTPIPTTPVSNTTLPNNGSINNIASPNGMKDHSTISPLKKMFPLRKRFKTELSNEENPYASPSFGPTSPPITPIVPTTEPTKDVEPKSPPQKPSTPTPSLPTPTTTSSASAAPPLPPPSTNATIPTAPTVLDKPTPKTPTPLQRAVTSSPSPKRIEKPTSPTSTTKNDTPESVLPPRKAKLAVYNAGEESEKPRELMSPKATSESLDPDQRKKSATEKKALDKKLEKLAKPAQKRKMSLETQEKPKKKRLSRSRIIDSDDEQSDDEATTSASESDSESESENESEDDGKLYCLCKKPYDKNDFMIACDSCDDWFHTRCVGISQAAAKRLKQYICPTCRPEDSINPRLQQKREMKPAKVEAKPPKKVVKKVEKKEDRKEKKKPSKTGGRANVKTTKAEVSPPPGSPKVTKCLNKHCNAAAKPNSKYCSHKCGVSVALENLKKKEEKRSDDEYSLEDLRKELRLKIHSIRQSRESNGDVMLQGAGVLGTSSVAEIEDLNALEEIDRKKKEIEKGLQTLAKRAEELETAIEVASSLSTSTNVKRDKPGFTRPESRDTMDCPSCGKPIAAATFARHLEQCSIVKERSKSASGDRNRLCGCPTNDVECGYCTIPKETCGKHIGWEGLRKAELIQEKNQLTETVEALNGEEQIIKLRISRRRQASSSEQHRTIVERTPNHLFSIVSQITPPSSKPTATATTTPSSSSSDPSSVTTPASSSAPVVASSTLSSLPLSTTASSSTPSSSSSLDTAVPPSPSEAPKATETALASSTPATAIATS